MAKNFTWRYFTAATLLCFFFSATFTTVNAQCDATTKPIFGWTLTGIVSVYNINNGSVDPSELATVTLCEGDRYGVEGHFEQQYHWYKITNVVSGDALLFDGVPVTNSDRVVNIRKLQQEERGTHSFTLVDPGVNGATLVQTVTPFYDLNRNELFDDGDCVGDPIVFTFVITPGARWYKDVDGDLHAAKTSRACLSPGQGWTTTKLPVDDCDDNDSNNAGPTFGYNFNGTPVYDINNGSVDPSESATLTICEGESYSVSGHFHNSESNKYKITDVVSGGALELNGLNVINLVSVLTAAQLSGTAGTYRFRLLDPGVSGTLVQRIIPFRDNNNNNILDDGDCVGERIIITYIVTPGATWYKDVDGDLHASTTTRRCSSPGQGWTTTVLPLDDCNDNDVNNSGPTFGFNFNGTAVASISNGTVDPGETASLTVCDGESFSTSGHFYTSFSNLFVVSSTASVGTILINGVALVSSESVITAGQLSGTAGTYALTLANPAVGGVLIQKITPFADANNNGIPDEGDCIGDPIVFTYTVTTGSKTWYKDADGDGYGGQSCQVRACVKPRGYVSCNTDCDDNNKLVHEPITYYRDADGDGYGDPNSSISVCKSDAPSGYVKNNYDWNDQNKAGKSSDERITMCLNGNTEIVYVKYLDKKLSQGWKPGPCSNGTIKVTKGANDKPEKTARNTADQTIPEEYSLSNSPNPFKGTSTIKYGLPVDSKVLIVVYDITGRNLGTLVNGDKKAGNYTVNFKAAGLSNGIYYYRIAAKSSEGQFDQTNKMVLVR